MENFPKKLKTNSTILTETKVKNQLALSDNLRRKNCEQAETRTCQSD